MSSITRLSNYSGGRKIKIFFFTWNWPFTHRFITITTIKVRRNWDLLLGLILLLWLKVYLVVWYTSFLSSNLFLCTTFIISYKAIFTKGKMRAHSQIMFNKTSAILRFHKVYPRIALHIGSIIFLPRCTIFIPKHTGSIPLYILWHFRTIFLMLKK